MSRASHQRRKHKLKERGGHSRSPVVKNYVKALLACEATWVVSLWIGSTLIAVVHETPDGPAWRTSLMPASWVLDTDDEAVTRLEDFIADLPLYLALGGLGIDGELVIKERPTAVARLSLSPASTRALAMLRKDMGAAWSV